MIYSIQIFSFIWITSLISLAACSPKVYLIDRQTVLEDEAAGEWPEFEKDLLNKTKAHGPTPFPKTADSAKKQRLYQVLNGEMTSSMNVGVTFLPKKTKKD